MNEGSRKCRANRRLRRLRGWGGGGSHGSDTHAAAADFSEGESRVKSGYNGVYGEGPGQEVLCCMSAGLRHG